MPHFDAGGYRLFYRENGRGPLFLILHGNTSSSACHEGELEYFGSRFHAVAPDLLGNGQSERVAPWPHDWWRQAARDAAALIEHIGGAPAIVTGSSGGGVAALILAIERPDLARAAVADSCVQRWTPEEVSAIFADRKRLSPGQVAFWQRAHGYDWQAVVDADTEMIRGYAGTGFDFYQGRLGEIRCPVLLTHSLADDLLPRVAEQVPKMAAEIPDCRAFLANSGRHPLMWSRSAEWRAMVDAFLGTLDRA